MPGVDAGPNCPGGYTLLPDAKVTQAISARAVALLQQWRGGNFPVGSTNSEETTSGLSLDYRYEWHPPDFQNPVKHTGVTVYYCAGGSAPTSPLAPASGAPSSSAPSPSGSSGQGSSQQPTSSGEAPAGADVANGAGACETPDGGVKFSLEGLLETLAEDAEKLV